MGKNLDRANQMLDLSPKLADLCKPLFNQTPISLYSYCEVHSNGTLFLASTNKSLVEGMFNSPKLQDELMPYVRHLRNEGFFLSDLHTDYKKDSEPFLNRLGKFGKGHECIFVDKTEKGCLRLHCFYGGLEDESINAFFLNNTTVMRYFSRYAVKELQPQLNVMDPYTLSRTGQKEAKGLIESVKPVEISTPKFLFSLVPHKTISKRQWEIIYWYFMGKTSHETATILGVKQGTVETHFLRIKEKLGCRTKQQIFRELLAHNDFWDELGVGAFLNKNCATAQENKL